MHSIQNADDEEDHLSSEEEKQQIVEKNQLSREKRTAYMREYRLNQREQKSAAGESGKLPPVAKRANHKAYMRAYRAQDQQAGKESISAEEMEASKRAKRAAYMRKYRAKEKPADD